MSSTKQATKTSAVTRSESLVLMKNMIRISVSSICYMRDLFPEYCYKSKEYGSVGIHQLQAAQKDENGEISIINSEAFLLTQWLEKGVFLALESEYLNSMTFAIFTKHPLTNEDLLVETYEFKVSYQADAPAKINGVALLSRDTVKNQAAKFIRSLTEFSGTLENLPPERWITLQLKYQENTPADYEPEYFRAANGNLLGSEMLPLKINVGSLKTPEVDMKVKFAGLESLLFEDLCKAGSLSNTHANALVGRTAEEPSMFNAVTHIDGEKPVAESDSWVHVDSPARVPVTTTAGGSLHGKRKKSKSNLLDQQDLSAHLSNLQVETDQSTNMESSPSEEEKTEETAVNVVSGASSPHKEEEDDEEKTFTFIRSYILNSGVATIRACCEKLDLKEGEVKKAFGRLIKEGIIQQKKKGGRYEVPASQPASSMTVIAPAPVTPKQGASKSFYRELEETAASSAVVSQFGEEDEIDESQPVESNTVGPGLGLGQQQRYNQSTLQIEQTGRKCNSGIVADTYGSNATTASIGSAFDKPLPKGGIKRKDTKESPSDAAGMYSLSQNSEASDGGHHSKRARKISVIQDPINLTHLGPKERGNVEPPRQ